MSTGVELIGLERYRQITQEGYDASHDDEHIDGELRDAAVCYCMTCDDYPSEMEPNQSIWPWDSIHWKPSEDPIRNLVKAGALIAAEIDRLKRKEEQIKQDEKLFGP